MDSLDRTRIRRSAPVFLDGRFRAVFFFLMIGSYLFFLDDRLRSVVFLMMVGFGSGHFSLIKDLELDPGQCQPRPDPQSCKVPHFLLVCQ